MPFLDELEQETVLLDEPSPGLVVATLHRPDRLNAMNVGTFEELLSLARALEADRDMRVLVVTGSRTAFCSGYDLADAEELSALTVEEMMARQDRAAAALVALRAMRIPVLAAVNGVAAGGGLSLALAADIRLAGMTALFSSGLTAGDLGTSWLLPRIIGAALSAELGYTGRFMEAEEAERVGLVNSIHEPDQLLPAALALAGQICANAPGGVQMSKRALHASLETMSYAAAGEMENRGQVLLSRTDDVVTAMATLTRPEPDDPRRSR